MSARPRLVEEGKPIYDDNNDNDNHVAERRRSSGSSLAARATGGNASYSDSPEKNEKKPYRLTTRLVIGGDSSPEHQQEPEEMAIDMPHSGNHSGRHGTRYRHHHHNWRGGAPRRGCSGSHRYVIGEDGQQEKPNPTHHHYVIGGQQENVTIQHDADNIDWSTVERMQGVEDHGTKGPLVVMDGANIAYAYADVMAAMEGSTSLATKARREPDARGIQVAAKYFLSIGIRVLVVIPTPWLRAKPRPGDPSQDNALMVTPQLEALQELKARGLLVSAPPTDDDDAYCIVIARREDSRAVKRGEGGGFVVSNDMFRDAVQRDGSGDLKAWLNERSNHDNGPGRISFAFCDMGTMDDHGDREMDFVPNPRHPLVSWIESQHRSNNTNSY